MKNSMEQILTVNIQCGNSLSTLVFQLIIIIYRARWVVRFAERRLVKRLASYGLSFRRNLHTITNYINIYYK